MLMAQRLTCGHNLQNLISVRALHKMYLSTAMAKYVFLPKQKPFQESKVPLSGQ